MLDKLISDRIKILSFKYNTTKFAFEIECLLSGDKVPSIHIFDKNNFPNHKPLKILDEHVQIGEIVHIWIKEEELLKNEGWNDVTKHTLASPDSPFKIGKGKKVYLGGAHKGIVCLDNKFRPFVAIKQYRFSPNEIKMILRTDNMFQGKSVELIGPKGKYKYNADTQVLFTANGYAMGSDEINSLIDVFRKARLI